MLADVQVSLVTGGAALVNCGRELSVNGVFLLVGVSWLTVGHWLGQWVREVNASQGGWRATYARMAPQWGVTAAGVVGILFVATWFAPWQEACLMSVTSPGATVLWVLALVVALFNTGLLIRNRIAVDRRFRAKQGVAAAEPSNGDDDNSGKSEGNDGKGFYRSVLSDFGPRIRVIIVYGVLAVLALVLALNAFALMQRSVP